MHSPLKANKFNEPTISSIRKSKVTPNPTDSSLSSRSVSKDKKTMSLTKRVKVTSKYIINKNKNVYEDKTTPQGKNTWKKKRSIPGLK